MLLLTMCRSGCLVGNTRPVWLAAVLLTQLLRPADHKACMQLHVQHGKQNSALCHTLQHGSSRHGGRTAIQGIVSQHASQNAPINRCCCLLLHHFCRIIGQDGQRFRPGRVWHNVHGALAGGAGEIHRSSAAADASECRLLGLLCWADTYVSTHIV